MQDTTSVDVTGFDTNLINPIRLKDESTTKADDKGAAKIADKTIKSIAEKYGDDVLGDAKMLFYTQSKESSIDTKVKYSPSGLKLSSSEAAKFLSSVSTDYYLPYKTHKGLQYQSCVFDDKHILYIYEDGGFGNYNPVGRIDYQDIDVANEFVEEIKNGKHYKITEVVNTILQTYRIGRSSYSLHYARSKKRIGTGSDGVILKRKP